MKKNAFSRARNTIRRLELDISENTVWRRLDDTGMYKYRAIKNPFLSTKNQKHIWSSQKLTEIGW